MSQNPLDVRVADEDIVIDQPEIGPGHVEWVLHPAVQRDVLVFGRDMVGVEEYPGLTPVELGHQGFGLRIPDVPTVDIR